MLSLHRKIFRGSFVLILLLLAAAPVSSFSAHLSRPWDGGPHGSSSHTSQPKKRQWRESNLASQTEDRDEATTDEHSSASAASEQRDQEEERNIMSLPDAAVVDGSGVKHGFTDPLAVVTPSTQPLVEIPTVWSSRKDLWGMCRPSNFPGVTLFHVIAVHLALGHAKTGAKLLPTLVRPTILVVLFCILLNSSASMVINDYFDKQLGVDSQKMDRPLVKGTVSMPVARRFLNYLYSALLLSSTVVPGIPTRLSVIVGTMSTFWYTKHLKPLTWIKNVVCAGLIALSPLTSGAAAYNVVGRSSWGVLATPSLMRMSGVLFAGFLGREILMDVNDTDDDRDSRVQTVPVRYGRRFATRVAFVCTILVGMIAVGGPLSDLAVSLQGSEEVWEALRSIMTSWRSDVLRRLLLATVGSGAMIYRTWQVYRDGGEDKATVDRAVEEGKLTVVILLASFL